MNWAYFSVLRLACRHLTRTLLRLRGHGLEHVPRAGGLLLASNHQSFLDPVLATCLLDRQCWYLARRTLFRGAFGRFIRTVNAVPLERGEADSAALRAALALLDQNRALLLFPEGTRTRDGALGVVRSGVGSLAARADVPVVPVYIHGAFDAWPRTYRLPRPGRVHVFYGPPVRPADFPAELSRRARGERIAAEVARRLSRLECLAFAAAPVRPRPLAAGDGAAPEEST